MNWPALLKNDEAAQYLSVSVDTVEKLTRARELRKITLPGTTAARYSRVELDAAIERWGRRSA
jgi:excisionase family DNA binding protein